MQHVLNNSKSTSLLFLIDYFYILDNSVYVVLPLADQYQIERLVLDCEQFLLKTPSVAHLVTAERYNLKMLEDACVQHLEMTRYKVIRANEDYKNISGLDKPINKILHTKIEKLLQCRVQMVNEVVMFMNGESVKEEDLFKARTYRYGHASYCHFEALKRLTGSTSNYKDCKKCLFDVVHNILKQNADYM